MGLETKRGTVVHLNPKRGFGFIVDDDGKELFFHASGVVRPCFEELKAGLPVEFFAIEDALKRPLKRAIGVTVI